MRHSLNVDERPWGATYRACGVSGRMPVIEEKSLADYIERHVLDNPEAEALVYLGQVMTYRQLDAYGNRFAHVLRSFGCSKGDVIGIHLPNTPQYVVAVVAAAKLGCIVSGVSPLLTPPELVHQVNDAGIKVLLTLDQLFNAAIAPVDGQCPGLRAVLVSGPIDFLPGWKKWLAHALKKVPRVALKTMTLTTVQPFWPLLTRAPGKRIYTRLSFDDTIYVQYTGGTTGKPKGAELTLRSMFANARQGEAFAPYQLYRDTIGAAFPFFHMAGLSLLLVALQNGARFLVIPDPRNIDHFCKEMQRFRPTVLANVPTLYMMLADSVAFAQVDFSALRIALSGAAPFPVEAIRKLEAVIGRGKLCEVYGMTESSPLLTTNPPMRPKIGTVGIPVAGTDICLVDVETGTQEVALGEEGEIIARGPQIMKGYLNLSEASGKTLREFRDETWLYTGDVGRMDDEGYITICDRSKDMLIVGGYKVFSVEVEGKLKELEMVDLCALIGRPDQARPGNDVVHLYVQLKPEAREQDPEQVCQQVLGFCRANMAAYKVPRHVHLVDTIPLTPVGKIDKKALRVG